MGESGFSGEMGYIKSTISAPKELVEKPILTNEKRALQLKESGIRARAIEDFKSMDIFSVDGVFSKEEVEDDKSEIVRIENRIYEDNQLEGKNKCGEKSGDDLEYIIAEKAELNNWFGENTFLSKTRRYDDLKNGIDFVVEYDLDEGPKQIALMIDASGDKVEKLQKKITRNINDIKQGNRMVKYFESQVDGYKGELDNVIPVVIGVDGIHTQEMIDHLGDKFDNHPAQIAFLEEIKVQLDYYSEVCPKYRPKDREKLAKINDLRGIINNVLEEKSGLKKQLRTKTYLENDAIYSAIEFCVDRKKAPTL